MKLLSFGLTLLVSVSAFAGSHFCASQVKAPAIKLFALHYELSEADASNSISDDVTQLPSIRSPDGKRNYAVLQTDAYIGKMGYYRIRMIFAVLGKDNPKEDCVLMGQEILDMSSL